MPVERWWDAVTFGEFLDAAVANRGLWSEFYRRARVEAAAVERVAALGGRWHLLVLSEDWCGDAVNTVPVLARLADLAPNLELRLLGRDSNPELMDAHLTGTSRSIPVVMVLDGQLRETGWWGPRPSELQRWFVETGRRLPPKERYTALRRWYARDRGRSTVEEVVMLLERSARLRESA
ncbi:MAG: thioredoxin family protein [Gemmatimonadetes bacterium]|nr:thioredoxin family protein [Gemmatimonadota bacterium]